jgi:hypothetical protein
MESSIISSIVSNNKTNDNIKDDDNVKYDYDNNNDKTNVGEINIDDFMITDYDSEYVKTIHSINDNTKKINDDISTIICTQVSTIVETNINILTNSLNQRLDKNFNNINQRLDVDLGNIDQKVDLIDGRSIKEIGEINKRLDTIEGNLKIFEKNIVSLLNKLDSKITFLEKNIKNTILNNRNNTYDSSSINETIANSPTFLNKHPLKPLLSYRSIPGMNLQSDDQFKYMFKENQ